MLIYECHELILMASLPEPFHRNFLAILAYLSETFKQYPRSIAFAKKISREK